MRDGFVKTQNSVFFFYFYGSVHRKYIPIYIQQDATLHSLFYLETTLHVSGGTIIHHQEHKQMYLQRLLFVTPLLLSAAIVEEYAYAYATHSTLKPFPTLIRVNINLPYSGTILIN